MTLQIWPYLGISKCWGHSVLQTPALVHREMRPNDADGMANSVDPDRRSSLIRLSENLGSLRYSK